MSVTDEPHKDILDMRNHPTKSTAPAGSEVISLVPGSYFYDAWAIRAAEPRLDALGQFMRVVKRTPVWIESLMAVRNRVTSMIGLKDLGGLSWVDPEKLDSEYRPGDRVGIFTLISNSPHEALFGDRDKHLDVVVSVHKHVVSEVDTTTVTVTTVVHVHNWVGRLYMIPVAPAHRIIARSMTRVIGAIT